MANHNLISVDTIISKLFRENIIGPEYNESDVIEMIGEALAAIGAFKQFEEKVEFLEIKDHKALLPEGMQEIVMAAYSLSTDVSTDDCTTSCGVDDTCLGACDEEDPDECWSSHNRYYIPEQRYYDVVKDYQTIYSKFTKDFYRNFLPLRLAASPFSVTNMMHCENCINMVYPSEYEYSIRNGMIYTSFQEGNVCLAYLSMPLDDNGYPMIPDLFEYQEAITAYIMMKDAKSRYYNEPSAAYRALYRELTRDWHWYVRAAKNRQMMPSNIDERERLYRGNMKLIKQHRGYTNFFGNLNDLDRFNLHGGTTRKRYRY